MSPPEVCLSPAPPSAEALTDHGVALARKGRRPQAIAHFRRALAQTPGYAKAHHNLGVALAEEGKLDEAVRSLTEALRWRPNYLDALYNLGNVYHQLRRHEEAVAAFRRALALQPDHVESLNNLGLTLVYLGQFGEAIILLQQAVRLRPKFAEAYNNLGLARSEAGDLREAAEALEQALRLDPRYAEAHTNLGNNYKEQGRLPEALACYEMALALQPKSLTPRWNRSLALLQRGEFGRGWPEYDARLQKPDCEVRTFPQPLWDGAPLAGRTILLHMEQGLGDMIQFLRYAPLVQRQGGRVVVSCPARLRQLFGRCPGIDVLVDEKGELPAFDVHAPLLSLPARFQTTLETVPADVPYLSADPALVERWEPRLAELRGMRVGVCWQGNPRHRSDRQRSFPLAELEPLARVPGVTLVSLQRGPGAEQQARVARRFHVEEVANDLDQEAGAFMDTAAIMTHLDLVVTADTAIAHLAGALGVPVWIALARVPDWRWLLGRDDSPWYPTATLYRQRTTGDWGPVFAAMARDLERLLAGSQ